MDDERVRTPFPLPALIAGRALDWDRDGIDWPNRDASRFISAGGLRWHVQLMGNGPTLLLVHGTGAATHSWRTLAPLLAERFTVVAPDLPGHGFTRGATRRSLSLRGMAAGVSHLLRETRQEPIVALGHSAGAAILCEMSLDGHIAPRTLVSLNGSLRPLRRFARRLYPPAAKLLTWNPIVPRWAARRARDPAVVEGLLRRTGSRLDAEGLRLYTLLARNPSHVAGALGMMAAWDLDALAERLPGLDTRLVLVAAERDGFVPPGDAEVVGRRIPRAEVVKLAGLGHLAHEERPDEIAALLGELEPPIDAEGGSRRPRQ